MTSNLQKLGADKNPFLNPDNLEACKTLHFILSKTLVIGDVPSEVKNIKLNLPRFVKTYNLYWIMTHDESSKTKNLIYIASPESFPYMAKVWEARNVAIDTLNPNIEGIDHDEMRALVIFNTQDALKYFDNAYITFADPFLKNDGGEYENTFSLRRGLHEVRDMFSAFDFMGWEKILEGTTSYETKYKDDRRFKLEAIFSEDMVRGVLGDRADGLGDAVICLFKTFDLFPHVDRKAIYDILYDRDRWDDILREKVLADRRTSAKSTSKAERSAKVRPDY